MLQRRTSWIGVLFHFPSLYFNSQCNDVSAFIDISLLVLQWFAKTTPLSLSNVVKYLDQWTNPTYCNQTGSVQRGMRRWMILWFFHYDDFKCYWFAGGNAGEAGLLSQNSSALRSLSAECYCLRSLQQGRRMSVQNYLGLDPRSIEGRLSSSASVHVIGTNTVTIVCVMNACSARMSIFTHGSSTVELVHNMSAMKLEICPPVGATVASAVGVNGYKANHFWSRFCKPACMALAAPEVLWRPRPLRHLNLQKPIGQVDPSSASRSRRNSFERMVGFV